MTTDKRKKIKGRSSEGRFFGIPKIVLDHDDFRKLSGSATKILIMIGSQYRGYNNGDLEASFSLAKKWGIGSESTLCKGIKELTAANLIVRTREGMFLNPGRRCALYALTWNAIDDCNGKLDVKATKTPPRKFSVEKNTTPATENAAIDYKKCSLSQENTLSERINGFDKCSHTANFHMSMATKNEDLIKLP